MSDILENNIEAPAENRLGCVKRKTFHIIDFFKQYKILLIAIVVICIMYSFLYQALDREILSHNDCDNYTIQALAWWSGQANINQDYSNLELAYYKGKIYSSFPPFPTVVEFLLVPFMGKDTPNNLLTTIYTILSFIVIYLMCKRKKLSDLIALFWSGFLVFGSNLIALSLEGSVWFTAQTMNFLLTSLSIYFITSKKPMHWHIGFACWAMAIGCRPFQIVFFPIYLFILYKKMKSADEHMKLKSFAMKMNVFLISPIFIGLLYAAFNFIRFDNPFEFGHNYLPEFVQAQYGQFNIKYIAANVGNIFRMPTFQGTLSFPKFDGFAFYIANPFFIPYFTRLFIKLFQKARPIDFLLLGCVLLHIIITLSHRTLGGWQFGIRYFVDFLPYLFLYIYMTNKRMKIYIHEYLLFAVGLFINIYGTLWLYLEWK